MWMFEAPAGPGLARAKYQLIQFMQFSHPLLDIVIYVFFCTAGSIFHDQDILPTLTQENDIESSLFQLSAFGCSIVCC